MRDYVSTLMARGEMRIVEREVDPRFELAAVTHRSQRESDLPILFKRVKGTSFSVVTNVYGSRNRLCELIGAEPGRFCQRWAGLMKNGEAAPLTPRAFAPSDDLVSGRLSDLPQITYCEHDAGPYITSGVFLAKEPETGVPNLSFHRCMYVSDRELRVRLGGSHDLTKYQLKAEAAGHALGAAILIGAPPPIVLAAAASIPYDQSELAVAARLTRGLLPMRPCTHIEGRFLPHERRAEGPFGEFMGFYVPVGNNHVFETLGVFWRPGALYHSVLCGSPEDLRMLELAVATKVYQHLSSVLPGILDVSCVPTVMNTVVQIVQQYEGHARQVLLAAFGATMDWSKSCMVVDEDVDINDFNDVYWAFLTRGRADQRAFVIPDVPGFYRDPSKDHWGRLAMDATIPFGRKEEFRRKRIPAADTLNLMEYIG